MIPVSYTHLDVYKRQVYEGVIRSTFVIDGDGVIRVARYNVRAKGHVDSLLRALDKLDGSIF